MTKKQKFIAEMAEHIIPVTNSVSVSSRGGRVSTTVHRVASVDVWADQLKDGSYSIKIKRTFKGFDADTAEAIAKNLKLWLKQKGISYKGVKTYDHQRRNYLYCSGTGVVLYTQELPWR